MKGLVAVTPRSLSKHGHPELDALVGRGYKVVFPSPGKQPSAEELKRVLPSCVGILAGVEPITQEILHHCKNLKVISRNGVGINNIDLDAAKAQGVVVCRAEAANSRGVAELALAHILAGLRHVSWSNQVLKSGGWERKLGVEVEGKTLGLIGCGHIGLLLANMASSIGMRVIGYDPYPKEDAGIEGFSYQSLDTVFQQADVLSLHCPPAERPLINMETIAKLKQGIYIVNTARAELIDEDAVLVGLESAKISGIATDVFLTEPPGASSLLDHENVVITPHIGGLTKESVDRATTLAVFNLLGVLE